ncbi:hypothetical protein [Agromyces sp. S2-1-8]|uniref:hypothetical protein n=1 Tax=Agromyces sp. S2-1-8 TaxID=2897180 RepID=UPI001E2D1F4A|nr:hypothetical protein [Agromyces sp. S2-1-8]MCD5348446.1 hypothetical protein [Agromyces sp. S2-1-8]
MLLALGGWVICVVVAIRNARRVFRAFRHRHGHYNKRERAEMAARTRYERAWVAARQLVADVRSEILPQPIQVWGVATDPDEPFFFDVECDYQRFYGTTTSFWRSSGSFSGPPFFVLAGIAATAMANSSRESAAERAAATQWREHQRVRILVSNRRLLVHVNHQWLSFYHEAIAAYYPSVDQWCVVFEFASAEPMRLIGEGAPLIAVWTTLATHGRQGVLQHPGLERLR